MIQGAAVRVLAWAGGALAFVLLGMWAGYGIAQDQAEAKAGRQAKADLATYQRQVAEGEERAGALREQLTQQGRYLATLQERARHAAPLTVVQRHPAAAQQAACAGPAAARAEAPALATEDAAAELAGGADRVLLSLAALSLWNSALAGHDVPAGACRADDPASAACAAASAVELDAAFANQRANAASCAADRARHQALLDHLNSRRP